MSTSNLNAMLKTTVSTNSICLNYNGNHLIATLTDDILQMVSTLPIVWEQNSATGKPVKSSIYIDKWDEITAGADAPYTVGEIKNGKMVYLPHVYLIHSDNKALTTDAQKTVRQVIGTIAPYVGLVSYTVTSKTPRKNGSYMSWSWYGTTNSDVKHLYESAISEINNGCTSATETLENAKRWIATRQIVDDAGKSRVQTENAELKATVLELMEKLKRLESEKTDEKTAEK